MLLPHLHGDQDHCKEHQKRHDNPDVELADDHIGVGDVIANILQSVWIALIVDSLKFTYFVGI